MEVRTAIEFYKGQGKGGMKETKVEGEREKEKEAVVRHEMVSSKWTWNHGDFSRDRNKNYSV
jgi:hypothetical protein